MNVGSYLRNMIQIVFSPARGWEDLEADEKRLARQREPEDAAGGDTFRRCFLPVAAVCSLTYLLRLFYGDAGGVVGAIVGVVVMFVSLFLAAMIARWVMQIALPRLLAADAPDEAEERMRVMNLICYSLTYIALVEAVANAVKVHMALFAFLPLYLVFIIWKGADYLRVATESVLMYVIVASAATGGSAYLVLWLLRAVV